jgi:hypothetical protein
MANSQFTIYTSNDLGAPQLNGLTGSLLTVLDAVLINGYGTKTSAGWSRALTTTGSLTGYMPASGSKMTLFLNDMGPINAAVGKEAWFVGWENLTNATGSIAGGNMTGSVGAGNGQFPTPAQLLTTGHVVVRKSATATDIERYWQIFADAYTMYLFISSGDSVGEYVGASFGNVFSLRGSSDIFRCHISGRNAENSAAAGISDWDVLGSLASNLPAASCQHGWLTRGFGGGGSSVQLVRLGDASMGGTSVMTTSQPSVGSLIAPNGPDNSFYLSPIRIAEYASHIRGRLRGIYHVCHPVANFSDGQTFAGANDFVGKTFMIVKSGPNAGYWAIEISNTVETN